MYVKDVVDGIRHHAVGKGVTIDVGGVKGIIHNGVGRGCNGVYRQTGIFKKVRRKEENGYSLV